MGVYNTISIVDGLPFLREQKMGRSNTNRNIFGSVALTSRLGGFIPWFLQRSPDPEGNANLNSELLLAARSTIYESQRRLVVHGLERTGTGFCAELIRRNLENIKIDCSTKHNLFDKGKQTEGPPWYYEGCNLIKYIICVRHPYSWFISYKRYHEVRCSGRIPGVNMLTHTCSRMDFPCYIETFNLLYSKWIEECSKLYEYAIIRYEDILEHPEASMDLLCSRLSLSRNRPFSEVNEYMNNYSGYDALPGGYFSRRDYYLKKEYIHDLSPENKATINKLIDKNLVRTLGYSLDI
jgi:hypothetical protein